MRSEFCSEHKYRSLTFNTSMGNTSMIKQDYTEIKDRVAIIFYEQYYQILPVIRYMPPTQKGQAVLHVFSLGVCRAIQLGNSCPVID